MQIAPISLSHPEQNASATVLGTLEIIDQGIALLMQVNANDYTLAYPPLVTSSIGEHCRHILDIFHALSDPENGVNYNIRRRGHKVETSRDHAIEEFQTIKKWLLQLTTEELKNSIPVETEVALSDTLSVETLSQLEREVAFAASHATHHYALIKVLAILLGYKPDPELGFAPATATFLREQE